MNRPKTNPQNDRAKRDYLIWLKEAKQRSPATVEQARHAIDRLEAYTGFKDFGTFNKDQAIGFKNALSATTAQRSGKPVSLATVHHTLHAVKDFLAALHGKPEYRRRINPAHIAYLNLTTGEERQAHVSAPKKYASLDEYRTALFAMPAETEIERRNQAIMALMLLTCVRDGVVVGLKLRHLSIDRKHLFQDPRDVKTKFRKAIDTFFFPVGDDVVVVLGDWVQFLATNKHFGPDLPLFPKGVVGQNPDRNFAIRGLGLDHLANASIVRGIFKTMFESVGLPYVNPHTVRDTITQLGYARGLTAEQFKAWSQNMGHDKPLTTFNNYGQVSIERQGAIFEDLRDRPTAESVDDAFADKLADKIAARMRNK